MRILLALFLVTPAFATDPATPASRLGDRDFHAREAAGKQLDALGEASLPALKDVIAIGTPEAVRRAQAIHTRVTARIEGAKALVPKLVSLDFRNAGFLKIAEEVFRQTGTRLKSHDPAVLLEAFTIRVTNRPFWEVVEALGAQHGLTVGEVVNEETRKLQVQLEHAEERLRRFGTASDQSLTDANSRRIVERDSVQWERTAREARAGLVRLAAGRPDTPVGTVTLVRGKPFVARTDLSVRLVALPFGGNLSEVSSEFIPFVLELNAEPGKHWGGVTDVFITNAVADGGTKLAPALPCCHRRYPLGSSYSFSLHSPTPAFELPLIADARLGSVRLNGRQAVALLAAPPGKAVAKLAVVEGFVRGELWRAGRKHQVEVPFKLTDVPVAAGTRDPNGVVSSPGYNFNTTGR